MSEHINIIVEIGTEDKHPSIHVPSSGLYSRLRAWFEKWVKSCCNGCLFHF